MKTAPLYVRRVGCALIFGLVGASFAAADTPDTRGATVSTDRVEVSYRNIDGFAEMKRLHGVRTDWLDELSRYVAKRAARNVPDGARLLVTITDVQRAGQIEPWHGPASSDLRIVRDNTPPRIDLNFRLVAANGAVLKEGTRQLRDIAFLSRAGYHRDEPLSHEKNLIDDWLRKDFGPARR